MYVGKKREIPPFDYCEIGNRRYQTALEVKTEEIHRMQSTIVRLNRNLFYEGFTVMLSEEDVRESVNILIRAGEEQQNVTRSDNEPSTSGLNQHLRHQKNATFTKNCVISDSSDDDDFTPFADTSNVGQNDDDFTSFADSIQQEHSITNDTSDVGQNSSLLILPHANVSLSNDTMTTEPDLQDSR